MITTSMYFNIVLIFRQGHNDLATFIEGMTKIMDFTGPWIAFGGSYPGSMAAWVREKFPHLIQGSVSSSGPLLAKVRIYKSSSRSKIKKLVKKYPMYIVL